MALCGHGGDRSRRSVRKASRCGTRSVYHSFCRGQAKPALPPRLLHLCVVRSDYLRPAQLRWPGSRDGDRKMVSPPDLRWRLLPDRGDRSVFWGARPAAAREALDPAGEGHERRYFYGSVWAVCLAQPVLGVLWKVLPHARWADALKLAVFVATVAAVGKMAERGLLPRTRPIVPGQLAILAD